MGNVRGIVDWQELPTPEQTQLVNKSGGSFIATISSVFVFFCFQE
jgi:hypothetical protein